MYQSQHIIEKVFLEVNTSSMETAQNIKNNIDLFLKNELFPRLDSLFDFYNLNNDIIRFDEMDINLSVEKLDNFNEIKSVIINQFEQKLNFEFQSIPEFKFSEIEVHKQTGNQIQRLTSHSNSGEIFLFYLENGFLPWFGSEEKINDLVKTENWGHFLDDPTFFTTFKSLIYRNKFAFDRFIFQFSDETIIAFLSRINQIISSTSKSILTICQKLESESNYLLQKLLFQLSYDDNLELEITAKSLFMQLMNSSEDGSIDSQTISKLKNLLIKILPLELIEKREFLNEFNIRDIQLKKLEQSLKLDSLYDEIDGVLGKTRKRKVETLYQEKNNAPPPIEIAREIADKQAKKVEVEDKITEEKIHSEAIKKHEEQTFFVKGLKEIAIQNAGLILLHPFLKHFFLELKIINDLGELTRKDLAIQALHYIATGLENVFEGNLVFEKFLCDIPLQAPIQKKSLLNDTIKNEANTLLGEVLKNWPALKNTSPDGLRQMFIQREGKLVQNDKNFKLIVERKAHDILLEKLNWNISIIKLPWMKEMVFVEW